MGGQLFEFTLDDRFWPNPTIQGSIAGRQVGYRAVAATGRN